jgi:hypothetical protein
MAFSWSCDGSHETRDTKKRSEGASPNRLLALGPPLRHAIPPLFHDMLYIVEEICKKGQFPIDHWHEAIGDPTLADAILDRLVHNAYKPSLKGDSMRKRLSPHNTEEPKA